MNKSDYIIFKGYLKDISSSAGSQGIVLVLLNLTLILLEGTNIVLLIPLLSTIGIVEYQGQNDFLDFVMVLYSKTGFPLTLEGILSIFVLILLLESGLKYSNSVLSAKINNNFISDLRNKLFTAFAYSSWLFISGTKFAKISRTITQEIQHIKFGTTILFQTISIIIVALVHLVLAFYISSLLTTVTLLSAILLIIVTHPVNKVIKKTSVSLLGFRDSMFSIINNFTEGLKVSKSFGVEKFYAGEFQQLTEKMEDAFNRNAKVFSLANSMLGVGAGIIVAILVYLANNVFNTTSAELLLLVYIFFRTVPRINTVQKNFFQILNMFPSYSEINQTILETMENAEGADKAKENYIHLNEKIKFENITFSYKRGEEKILFENVSFSIDAHDTTVVTGSSGSGKTTIADLLMGLLIPESGSIFIDNEPLTMNNIRSWRGKIGYVPQEPYLINDTIKKNVLFGKLDAVDDDVLNALQKSSALDFIDKLPDGIETLVGNRGIELSGGERQRIALARALIREPEVLILDEATNSIDSENEDKIFEALERLHHKLTIILISHRDSTIRRADRKLLVEDGKIKEMQKPIKVNKILSV